MCAAYLKNPIPIPILATRQTAMDLFQEAVSRDPEKVALASRCEILSYASLNERVNQLARHLRSQGVGPDVTVAVALERGIEYVIAMFACWKLGATYLPLDQSLPAKRMEHMMLDSGAACLITVERIMEEYLLAGKFSTTFCLDDQRLINRLRTHHGTDVRLELNGDDVAYIIYTSGTTGNPKGVCITHDSVFNLVDDIRKSEEIESSDLVLLFSSFCFDASIRDITGALMLGASLYIPQLEEILPDRLISTIAQRGITNLVITSSVLRRCTLKSLPPCLNTIVLAGEAADEALVKTWGAGRKLINAYGHTEATVCSTKQVYLDGIIPREHSTSVIGDPILHTTISILDANNNSVDQGQVGEICVTGPGVSCLGYLNMPELNAKRFIDGMPGQYRSYKTGDLGRILSNGTIECIGRKESMKQIKLNGHCIELEEVENVLRNTSYVLDALVVAQGAAPVSSLCAYVVPRLHGSKSSKETLTAQLRSHMRDNLPSYSIPSLIKIIDAFPLSTNKQLDYIALAKLKSYDDITSSSTSKTLLTPLETGVALALLDSMNLPSEQAVSPETTYGELGGGSLQASMVLRRLNKNLGCSIAFGQFFRKDSSIRHIASLISGEHQQPLNPSSEDLLRCSILPRGIAYNVRQPGLRRTMHFLLTGCTGFLGSHLLAEILSTKCCRISCIVRARDKKAALSRIVAAFQTWGLWKEHYNSRLNVFCGDVSKPFLGLSFNEYQDLTREVDTVYHSAAAVNFIAPFAELQEANIAGTVEILRFASTLFPKRLIFVSTLSVFFNTNTQISCGMEMPVDGQHTGLVTGYAQSKWVSEQLLHAYAQLGGHVLIIRPGRFLGNTQNYVCPRDDFTMRLLASIVELGVAPNLEDIGVSNWLIDLTPVNICARLIHMLSSLGQTGIRHIINRNTVSFDSIVNALGGHIKKIPYGEWLRLIPQSTQLAPLSSLFHEPVSDQDGRSTFETLLHIEPFRRSCYQSTISERALDLMLPPTVKLLEKYLEVNMGISPGTK